MNQPTKQTYQNDLILQGLFYIPMMFLYLIGIVAPGGLVLGALTQFFVGVSQVMSGTFHTVRYEDEEHKRYLRIAIAYLTFLFLGGMSLSVFNFGGVELLIILFLFVIPVGIATWYYRLTWLAYKNAATFIDKRPQNKPFQEDILDDAML